MQAELHFIVLLDEDGNYCAEAHTEQGDLFTDSRSMDGLMVELGNLIELYRQDTGVAVSGFTLHFEAQKPLAA